MRAIATIPRFRNLFQELVCLADLSIASLQGTSFHCVTLTYDMPDPFILFNRLRMVSRNGGADRAHPAPKLGTVEFGCLSCPATCADSKIYAFSIACEH